MIIAAFREGQTRVYTRSAYQFDKGQKLVVTGIDLPESFEVHYANKGDSGLAYSCIGNPEGIYIPDSLFVSGDYIYVWIYATEVGHEGTTSGLNYDPEEETIQQEEVDARTFTEGTTVYEIVIPIIRKPVQLPTVPIDSTGSFGYTMDENGDLVPVNH